MKDRFNIISSGVNIVWFCWESLVNAFEAADEEWARVYEPSIQITKLKASNKRAYHIEKVKFKIANKGRDPFEGMYLSGAIYLNQLYYRGIYRNAIRNFPELNVENVNWTYIND